MKAATQQDGGVRPGSKPQARSSEPPRIEALVIERLITQLTPIWERRLGLVVAPPGSGKSTLLAAFADGTNAPVAWYRADRWDGTAETLAARLGGAFAPLIGGPSDAWSGLDDVASGLAAWDPERALLVIDDLHVLDGTPAQEGLERLLEQAPPGLRVLVASRSQPPFNLSRARLSGDVVEIGPDDLRFRTWEVERLFRDHYGEPMAPEDLARLAHWTEGWAAGLQLFHLATRGRPAGERRRVLRSLGPRSRLAREYLTQNVLDRVPDELNRFLIDTSVLGRLSGRLCDRLLERTGSEALLDELERRCLFTTRFDDAGAYRYHEVFRSYLQSVLVLEIGDEGTRDRFIAAGDLLSSEGLEADALEAYVRAEAWEMADRVLAADGAAIAAKPLGWLGAEVQHSLRDDPWMGLAGARRLRAQGRFADSVQAYAVVADHGRSAAAAEAARRERAAIVSWIDPDRIHPAGRRETWWSLLREALEHDPGAVAVRTRDDDDAATRLVGGLCLLLSGDIDRARAELAEVADRPDAEGLLACIASLAGGAAALIAGDDAELTELNGGIGAAEGLGWDWLARVGRSMLAISGRPDHLREALKLEEAAAAADDEWGVVLARLARAWGNLVTSGVAHGPMGVAADDRAAAGLAGHQLGRLGAPVLEAWAIAIDAVGTPHQATDQPTDASSVGVGLARSRTRSLWPDAARLIIAVAEARAAGDMRTSELSRARLAHEYGISLPPGTTGGFAEPAEHEARAPSSAPPLSPRGTSALPANVAPGPPASLRLFGQLQLEIGGQAIDLGVIRPRVRTLLQILALNVGSPIHRETIAEALWPDAEPAASGRNLHVAIASLRRVLEPRAARGSFRFVLRDGESYLLSLPPGSWIDLVTFEDAMGDLRSASLRDDTDEVARCCRVALGRYSGDLLSEAGPADWVLARRDGLRAQVVEATTVLASILLDRGDAREAATVCLGGLEHDRFHDPIWQLLIRARETSGDVAAAMSVRSGYQRTLAELGIEPLADLP